jgi:hypothetical protein
MDDIMDILDQREEQYGNYRDVAKISQCIKMALKIVHTDYNGGRLSYVQRESLDMMATKMARIVSGNADNIDDWLDIEGYARLVRNILERKNG